MFGLAGFVLPAAEVRGFGTSIFQRKCQKLDFEIQRSGEHPAVWETNGASLFTVTNVTRYRELREFTNRLFNKIERLGGFVFYVGLRKTAAPAAHRPNRLYARVFLEAICSRARATAEFWTRVDRKMLWSPAASSDRQRARVLACVKARRSAPPPLRGAQGLDPGSAHARPDWLLPTMPNPDPLHVVVDELSRMTPFRATVDRSSGSTSFVMRNATRAAVLW